ncbi:allantoicase [Nocardia amikacinitolerans]|uniref:allantoicase n=1 Tax=Nocardia amikacinitolerans TaxID=756689 RepID=UPI0020A46354|nr:allantoicase [Nocardia amikacinitolerans]MCP2277518.1 allantoicase [Nocardia amikacinitolerans]
MSEADGHFTLLPDLAVRPLGGAVIWANDEFFAEKENLISPGVPEYRPSTFGHRGQVYDGWETRRRRGMPGDDAAVVRLGVPGVVRGIVVDTAWFRGNYPPAVSVAALEVEGYPTAESLAGRTDWTTLIDRAPIAGDARNPFPVDSEKRWTHVKLTMHPDGGVARLRVHGEGRPDPALLGLGPLDLAALENGALVLDCSNRFYSSPNQLLYLGSARCMGDGWETSRRRDDGNDWVRIRLAGPGLIRLAEIDTSYFLGNSPGSARLSGRTNDGTDVELLPRTELLPDTRHRFPIAPMAASVEEVRLDIYPDGGLARLRLYGELGA